MANLAHRASQFADKKFLIIHPTADGATILPVPLKRDNKRLAAADALSRLLLPEKVHFQHTAKLIGQLISQKANYTLQVGDWWPLSTSRG